MLNIEEAVQVQKIMTIFNHISQRVKADSNIQLPWKVILEIMLDSASSTTTRNFCKVFLEIGLSRTTEEERKTLVFHIIPGIGDLPSTLQKTTLQLLLDNLHGTRFSSPTEERKFFVERLFRSERDRELILAVFLDLVLLPFVPDSAEMFVLYFLILYC